MTQQYRNQNSRVVLCLFCGSQTFVPVSPSRDAADQEFGSGITLVRCHVCHKEAPYGASEMFLQRESSLAESDSRSGPAGL